MGEKYLTDEDDLTAVADMYDKVNNKFYVSEGTTFTASKEDT